MRWEHGQLQNPKMVIRVCMRIGVGWRECFLNVVIDLNMVVGHFSLVVVHFLAGSANFAKLEVVLGFKAMIEVTLHVYNAIDVHCTSIVGKYQVIEGLVSPLVESMMTSRRRRKKRLASQL